MDLIKVEFHVHTITSKDSILGKRALMIMCKLHNIKCIAISDHNEIKGALKYKEFFKKHKIQVIVSEEIFSKDGEIIGMFLEKKIPENLSAKETVNLIKKQGGLVYIPHPYDEKRKDTVLKPEALEDIKEEIDFIECHNGRNISERYSEIQEKIAKSYNKIPIVGSDAHTFFEIGRNYMILESIEKDKIIESVKQGILVKNKCIKFAHQWTKFVKIFKLIFKGEFYGIYRIIIRKCRKQN